MIPHQFISFEIKVTVKWLQCNYQSQSRGSCFFSRPGLIQCFAHDHFLYFSAESFPVSLSDCAEPKNEAQGKSRRKCYFQSRVLPFPVTSNLLRISWWQIESIQFNKCTRWLIDLSPLSDSSDCSTSRLSAIIGLEMKR